MTAVGDFINGIHRCFCGRLYKDYTGMMNGCDKCRAAIYEEFEKQEKIDAFIEDFKK